MKILLVEDNRDCRELLKAQIRRDLKGIGGIIEAGNGGAGVEKFKMCGPFDLVITDWMMPVFNGDKVCNEIRKLDENIPILCNTSEPEKAKDLAPFTAVFNKCGGNLELMEYLKSKFGSVGTSNQ